MLHYGSASAALQALQAVKVQSVSFCGKWPISCASCQVTGKLNVASAAVSVRRA